MVVAWQHAGHVRDARVDRIGRQANQGRRRHLPRWPLLSGTRRYYAASGAELFLHPTATTGNAWYRESRMGSYTDRDGLAVITDNVWGPDGYLLDVDGNPIYSVDENGDTVSSGRTLRAQLRRSRI